MHGIRGKVEFAWPCDEVTIDPQFVELGRVAQFCKNATIGTCIKPHRALESIRKFDVDAAVFQDTGFDWAVEWGIWLEENGPARLPIPVTRTLFTQMGASLKGASYLVPILRMPDIPSEVRLAAARELTRHPTLLADALERKVKDLLLPNDVRDFLNEARKRQKGGAA